MSDNTHAAMCVYCGESIIYDTREVTDMAAAHAQIIEHDQQCPKNPMVDRLAFLNQQNTTLQEQCDEYRDHLAVIAEMTGNKGDIGAAHEGVNAVIEERDALAAHLESLTSLWTELGYSMADGNDDAGQLWQALENLFASKSAASLARRDALKQAQGMNKAADIIANKAEAYNAEHGKTDPETGHREYPGDGAEYYNEMMELADELRQQAEGLR